MAKVAFAAVVLGTAAPWVARAGVLVEERSTFELLGPLGGIARMVGAGGGEDAVSTTAVDGDRRRTLAGETGELVDLAEGTVSTFDLKRGVYRVDSFEALRQAVERSRREAGAGGPAAPRGEGAERRPDEGERELEEALEQIEIDVELRSTGRTRTVNGFGTREVVLTVAAHARGTTLDQSGGIALRSEMWVAPKIPALQELAEFERRHARRLAGAIFGGAAAEDAPAMESAFAAHPMLKDVLVRMKTEGAKVDGSPILTVTTVDLVPSAADRAELAAEAERQERAARERSRPKRGKGLGGLLGGLAKEAVGEKVEAKVEEKLAGATKDAQDPTLVKITTEVVRVSTRVGAADLAVPAGLRRVD